MSSWLRLAHRTACVTGAASGIGRAVATALAVEGGCNVLLADADGRVEDVAKEIQRALLETSRLATATDNNNDASPSVEPFICNVTQPEQVQGMIGAADALAATAAAQTRATSRSGADDRSAPVASILVNCAGITRDALIDNMSVESFDDVIGVNLRGTWLACKYFCAENRLRLVQQQQQQQQQCDDASGAASVVRSTDWGASIINIGSVVSRTGNVGQSNYGASKGGVVGLTRSLAKEMARTGVRANAILPGFIDTAMAKAVPERIRDGIQCKIPLGGFGRPEDIANLTLVLASSERSGYITGESIECSGMIAL